MCEGPETGVTTHAKRNGNVLASTTPVLKRCPIHQARAEGQMLEVKIWLCGHAWGCHRHPQEQLKRRMRRGRTWRICHQARCRGRHCPARAQLWSICHALGPAADDGRPCGATDVLPAPKRHFGYNRFNKTQSDICAPIGRPQLLKTRNSSAQQFSHECAVILRRLPTTPKQ